MSRARTLAGAIGSDGALNVADVAGLAAVASSGSASDLSTGTLPLARLPNTGFELGFKNLLINGDARVSQRRGSSSLTTAYDYVSDRWYTVSYDNNWAGVNSTMQRMDMPPGTLLGGEHFTNFMRISPGSTATRTYFWQHIENLQQFDSRTITLSYWARVGTGTWATSSGSINRFEFSHDSASSTGDIYGSNPTFTTTWQKFTTTITVPSFSGKTFGVNSYLSVTILTANDIRSYSYFDITGIQLEYGSVATPFERRHVGLETTLCERYFQKCDSWNGAGNSSTNWLGVVSVRTPMRSSPSIGGTGPVTISDFYQYDINQSSFSAGTLSNGGGGSGVCLWLYNFSSLTSGKWYGGNRAINSNYLTLAAEI